MRSKVQTDGKVRLLTLTPLLLLSSLGLGSVIVMLMQGQNNENNGHLMNNVSRGSDTGTWLPGADTQLFMELGHQEVSRG